MAVLRGKLTLGLTGPGHDIGKSWATPEGMTMQKMEKLLITTTLQRARGNIRESAAILGIDRSTLYEKIKKYRIER